MRRAFTVTFLLISTITFAQVFTGKVVNVIDGNTFEIIDEYDEVATFMLGEADCPELGQELGEEAKAFSLKMILKKKVTVERIGKDWLGNKLAIIKLKNGKVLHEELLREGLAWASRKSTDKSASLQSSAQSSNAGLWAIDEPTPPWIFRRQQTMMQAKSR